MLHIPPTNSLLLTAKQEPYKKAYVLTKNTEEFLEKVQENRPAGRKKKEEDKIERVTGLGRKTREEIVKWNQMTGLRFQTGGETSDIPGSPSGGRRESERERTLIQFRSTSS